MADKVRWLLIGAGIIAGKRVAAAICNSKNSELAGVCDIAEENARNLAKQYGAAEVFTDIDRAIAQTSAEAVYVAAPVFLHVPTAIKALDAGKHVMVEKPLGLTAVDAGKLVDKARACKHLKAGCAYYRRFYPAFEYTKKMLDSGEFGDVSLVRMHFYSWGAFDADNWRVVKSKSGGGPLSDMGSHMLDVLIGLLGTPACIFAKVQTKTHNYEAEDSAAIIMRLPNNADVIATFHWNSKTWTHEFEIVGTKARIKWYPYDSGKLIKTVGRDIQEIDMPNADNVHQPLVEDFVEAILKNRSPAVSIEEALKTNIILDAVYDSSRTGKEITL